LRPNDPKKREKILTTAIELFLENGYQGTTTLAISKRAEMSSSHMYTYFRNKEHLLVEAVRRMEAEHTALSTEFAKKSIGLSDGSFIEGFYTAQATIAHRVRFIASCGLSPGLAHLFEGYDFDFSKVFMPFLKDWPEKEAADIAKALMALAVSYFLMGNIEAAKSASLSVLKNARNSLKAGKP